MVQNIFTIIIEEGYMTTKHKDEFGWLRQHLKKHQGKGDTQTVDLSQGRINGDIVSDSDMIVIRDFKEDIQSYGSK